MAQMKLSYSVCNPFTKVSKTSEASAPKIVAEMFRTYISSIGDSFYYVHTSYTLDKNGELKADNGSWETDGMDDDKRYESFWRHVELFRNNHYDPQRARNKYYRQLRAYYALNRV